LVNKNKPTFITNQIIVMTEVELVKYLEENKVEPLFKALLQSVCDSKPTDIPGFLIQQLEKMNTSEEKVFRKSITEFTFGAKSKEAMINEEDEEEEENTIIDTNLSENLRRRYSTSTIRRRAFSAESINLQDLDDFVPPYIVKTTEELNIINSAFSHNPLFGSVEKEDLEILYGAMFSMKYKSGDYIIKQGKTNSF
jgi:hypothetical protein